MKIKHLQARVAALAVAVVGVSISSAYGGAIYVDASAMGASTGTSWADAFNSLQGALAVATVSDEIRVAQGTYLPDGGYITPGGTRTAGSGDRAATFQLKTGVAIYGGFTSGGGTWEQRELAVNVTTLSGDLAGNDGPNFANNTENSYHVVTGSGTDATAIQDGFTIAGGNANGSSPDDSGGGVYVLSGSPTLRNCTFSGNAAAGNGGGVYINAGTPVIDQCIINNNSGGHGGGIYFRFTGVSTPTVTASTLSGNSAGNGGAVYCHESSPTITGCQIHGNSAEGGGGGGLYCYYFSAPGVTNSTISDNSAWKGGGVLADYYSNPGFVGCRIIGNSGTLGGGLYLSYSDPRITNCTILANTATDSGGGVYDYWSDTAVFANCTFSGNSANGYGGAVACSRAAGPAFKNCILWNDTAPTGTEVALRSSGGYLTSASFDHSDVAGGSAAVYMESVATLNWGTGNIEVEPLFLNAPGGDLRLRPGSPCIDAGSNAAVPIGVVTDLDGNARFFDDAGMPDCPYALGTCGPAPIVDMGAYEFSGVTLHRTISSWESVRTHTGVGPLPITLDALTLAGATVEPRQGGIQSVQVTFDAAVSVADASKITVVSGANAYTPLVSAAGSVLTLTFAVGALPDAQCYTIGIGARAMDQVIDGDADCNVRALVGDTTGNGSVNLGDALYVQSKIGQTVDNTTAAFDVDLDGTISMSDVLAVKALVTSPALQAVCP